MSIRFAGITHLLICGCRCSALCSVVSGYLSPSSDRYVKSKLGSDAISLEHRVHMCSLATAHSDWIDVCQWGEPVATFAAERLMVIFSLQLQQLYPQVELVVGCLCGADHALKGQFWHWTDGVMC